MEIKIKHKPLVLQLVKKIIRRIHTRKMVEGSHLVVQELADAFQVSRSPVREALEILQKNNILVFRPNCGFFLASSFEKNPTFDVEVPQPVEELKYRQIAEDRIRGKLQGHISEAELMSRYGISRVRLMKILMRMNQEGWVERRPGHGWTFTSILEDAEALDQGYRFRMLIEPAAIMEPAFKIDPFVIQRLRKEQEDIIAAPIDHGTPFRLFETGAFFHEGIVSFSGNRYLIEAIQNINRLRRLIEYTLKVDCARVEPLLEHIEIVDLLERDRKRAAAALLKDHINDARVKKISENIVKG